MKLRPSRAWFLAAALACCWGASGASADPAGSLPVSQSPYPRAPVLPSLSPGLGEIIQLVLSRTEENVLVSFVAKSKREYAPTVAELIYLRDVGVSGPVIAALILRAKRQPPGVVSGAPPPPKHKAQRYGREGFLELAQVRMSDQVLLAYLHTMDSPPQWGSQDIQIFKSRCIPGGVGNPSQPASWTKRRKRNETRAIKKTIPEITQQPYSQPADSRWKTAPCAIDIQ